MRFVLVVAALALAAAVIVPRYVATHGEAIAPTMLVAHPQAPAQTAGSDSHSVVISPNRNGHFEVEGHIDGRRMDFMVDTGASLVALTARDAAMLGIHPAERDYVATVKTANGVVHAAPVKLSMVEINDLSVRNVAAMVMPEGALSDNLLGLSFLSRLHRFEYSDGKLVLEQ